MIDEQINLAVDRFLDGEYGPSSFAEFASNRLGVEFDALESRFWAEVERLAGSPVPAEPD